MFKGSKRVGIELKRADVPRVTASMRTSWVRRGSWGRGVDIKQPILCKLKKHIKICKFNKQTIDCMSDYPIRTESQVSLLLKSFRQARGMTQADLGRALGVTQQTASDLERNASSASVSRLMRMLSVVGVELVLRDKQTASDTAAKPTSADW